MDEGVHSMEKISKIASASKSKFWATILFKIVRKLQPSSCVELGSCVGISASYQAAALKLNSKGKIVTLEGSEEVATIASETLSNLELSNSSVVIGPFHQTLMEVFKNSDPIDLFFNDGHHDRDAVINYFEKVLPYLSKNAVIVIDDISWSPGMKSAWMEIENDPRVSASINLDSIGIALIQANVGTKEKFVIPL